ncbi:hypothetical protein ACFSTC_18830 [Nonomuraea ferruginea]
MSFSTTPYSEVERRVTRQRRWAAATGLAAALLAAGLTRTARRR